MLKAIIVGNIGSDPDMRFLPNGTPRLQFNVASNGRTKNAAGEWEDKTEWCRVTIFGQRAETLSQHLTRGAKVYVDGRLETRPWIDRSNEPRPGLELVADTVEFASTRRGEDEGDHYNGYGAHATAQRSRPMPERVAVHGDRPAQRARS